MARNKDYWKKRMAALEDNQHRHGMDYYKDVQEQFRRATNSIQMDMERWYQRLADNNDISYAAAKRLLKKNELEEFHWSVEQYIKAGEENSVNQRWMKELENASARHHISYLEAMKIQAQQHAELLSAEFEGGMTDFLHKSYADSYYHTAFEISKGTGVGANIARLDDKRIDIMIKKPWARDGANFSDRIWTNKEKLVNNLHTELTQSIIRGDPPQKAIEGLAKTMNVSRAQAGRLIMTESAAVSSAAAQDSYKELGVEQYEILATLDSLTSEICRDLDGKVFDMKDYAVGDTAPPFHPHCRTTTIPYFDDEFSVVEKRAARDEETGDTVYVDGTLNYREWEKQYDDEKEPIQRNKGSKLGRGKGDSLGHTQRIEAGSVNPALREEAVIHFENDIRHQPIENAVVIDSSGNVVQFIGGKDSVDIFDVDLNGAIITHNHPESEGIVSFGEDDFLFLREHQNMQEFRCSNVQYNYRIKVLKNLDEVVYNDLYTEGFKYFGEKDFEPQDAAMRVLQERGYVIYERNQVDAKAKDEV